MTEGTTVAIWTALPLVTPFTETIAVRLPAVTGLVLNETVIDVAEAEITVPTAPLLKVTVLSFSVDENPKPLMTTVWLLAERFAVLLVTTGVTLAT